MLRLFMWGYYAFLSLYRGCFTSLSLYAGGLRLPKFLCERCNYITPQMGNSFYAKTVDVFRTTKKYLQLHILLWPYSIRMAVSTYKSINIYAKLIYFHFAYREDRSDMEYTTCLQIERTRDHNIFFIS